MPKRSRRRVELTPKEAAASAAVVAMFVGFLALYLGAELVLVARPHPLHWLAAGIGAAVGYGAAYGMVYWRRTHSR